MAAGSIGMAAAIVGAASILILPDIARAAEIKVLSTQATEEAYRELVPQFEKATGHKVTTVFTGTLDANKRLAAGESLRPPHHVERLDRRTHQERQGRRRQPRRSREIRRRCRRQGGAPKPDISTADALKKTLLAAKSIGYSTGPSGNYVMSLFEKLGIADEVKPKLKQTPTGVFVGSIIANGDVEIGFQQVSELSHFPGVDYVGPLPADVQRYTTFLERHHRRRQGGGGRERAGQVHHRAGGGGAYKKRGMEPG